MSIKFYFIKILSFKPTVQMLLLSVWLMKHHFYPNVWADQRIRQKFKSVIAG